MTTDYHAEGQRPDDAALAGAPPGPRRGGARDRWVKRGFLLAALIAVAAVGYHQCAYTLLKDWQTDLPAALEQARRENRPLVVIVYDSTADYDYGRLQVVVEKPASRKAMDRMEKLGGKPAIRVAARLKPEDPLARQYKVTEYPTTLLLDPRGGLVTAWVGYIPETDFPGRFLKGERQHP